MRQEFVVFTDESNIDSKRFSALSAVSMPYEHFSLVNGQVRWIVSTSEVREIKWEKVRNDRYYRCAEELLAFIIKNVQAYDLRVDVLVWDTHDSRHDVFGRDDIANYERMFYHLLRSSMTRRPAGSVWHIYPDERNGIDWDTVRGCLTSVGMRNRLEHTLFGCLYSDPSFLIKTFQERNSEEEPLIQVADLFSGLAVFSYEKYQAYLAWRHQDKGQMCLFNTGPTRKLSNGERYRSRLLYQFDVMCKERKLGVSLHEEQRLRTFNPLNPINFWPYTPQGDYDKAPTRGQRR